MPILFNFISDRRNAEGLGVIAKSAGAEPKLRRTTNSPVDWPGLPIVLYFGLHRSFQTRRFERATLIDAKGVRRGSPGASLTSFPDLRFSSQRASKYFNQIGKDTGSRWQATVFRRLLDCYLRGVDQSS